MNFIYLPLSFIAAKVEFIIEPSIRFAGQPGEQATMFFKDPSGNALEIKCFKDPRSYFYRKYSPRKIQQQALMKHAEVIIIGAGIIGSSIAYHLSLNGIKNIIVLDTIS